MALAVAAVAAGCIEDGIETSSSAAPVFSVDTLKIDDVFTGEGSTTHRFTVHNRYGRIMNISRIAFRNAGQSVFRINVDGQSGTEFSNIEIRPNDSIYVFVDATVVPTDGWEPVEASELLDFTVNGAVTSLVLQASGQNVERIRGLVVERDTLWSGDHARQIFDSLIVAPGARLTIGPGTRLYFHDQTTLRVDGTLAVEGTAEAPVDFRGDRRGNVAADIPFDLMASQWGGIVFSPTSRDSRMAFATVRNTSAGVRVDSLAGSGSQLPALDLLNCRLRNSAGYALAVSHAWLRAEGCELADASAGVLRLEGGRADIGYCTIANYYLFTALGGAAVQLHGLGLEDEPPTDAPPMTASFVNTIVYGNGADLNHGDLTGTSVRFANCLLKSDGSDDDNFIACLWNTDPKYLTDRSAYVFDYRLQEDSEALGRADVTLWPTVPTVDALGLPRPSLPAIGAYELALPAGE